MPSKNWIKAFESFALLVDRTTVRGDVVEFRVVLLAILEGDWADITRYDTAHGIPHRDILGRKQGLRFKRWMDDINANECALNMPSATAQKMPTRILRTTSHIDPRFVDVRPLKGKLSVKDSQAIMKSHGLRPMTADDSETFGKFFLKK